MFTSIFEGSPHARVLDFLVEHSGFDYNISELAKHSGVARPTVYKVVADFLKKGILVETRKVGNSQLYQLDLDSKTVAQLIEVGPALQPGAARHRAKLPSRRQPWSR
jgi:DNA-binding transcriptional ArsR family regulator